MRALEVLDREGSRDAGAPKLGPLKPLAEPAVELVAEYIVSSYAEDVVNRLRTLYARRESQAAPGTPDRRELARARMDLERIAPGFGGGSPLTPVLAAGASVSALASAFQFLGALDFTNRRLLAVSAAILFVVFFLCAGILLRGAAVARRRATLIMQGPLAARSETIRARGGAAARTAAEGFAISSGLRRWCGSSDRRCWRRSCCFSVPFRAPRRGRLRGTRADGRARDYLLTKCHDGDFEA
jgi:hypothetical protein